MNELSSGKGFGHRVEMWILLLMYLLSITFNKSLELQWFSTLWNGDFYPVSEDFCSSMTLILKLS